MSAAKSWFVQTGFGTRLGPMPDDALRELVRTGALVRTDQVREEATGDWKPAVEVPGLFEDESPSQQAPAERSTSLSSDENVEAAPAIPTPASSPTGLIPPVPPVSLRLKSEPSIKSSAPTTMTNASESLVPERPAIEPPVVATIMTAPVVDEPAITPPVSAESELINAWKMNRSRSKEDLGMESLADEMTQAEAVEDFAPELPSDLLDDDSMVASDVVVPASKRPRSSVPQPAFLDQVAGLESGPRLPTETTRQKWDRWKRSLPSRPILLVFVVAMIAITTTWWRWPKSQRGTYDRYVALWSEWKQRRLDLKNKEGCESFLRHVDAELNDIVPWLEKNTRATDKEKLLLLFIGRDCLKKIRTQPWQQGTPPERQLEFLLAQVHELYEQSTPTAPRDAFIGAKSVLPPKNSSPPVMKNRPTSGVVPDPKREPLESPIAVPKPTEANTTP